MNAKLVTRNLNQRRVCAVIVSDIFRNRTHQERQVVVLKQASKLNWHCQRHLQREGEAA